MSRASVIITPKTTVVVNPGINYGAPKTEQQRWVGEVRSFERRVRFGREMPCPWWKEYDCYADNEEQARWMLGQKAYRDGYALGGIQNIRVEARKT